MDERPQFKAEHLRPLNKIFDPDPRNVQPVSPLWEKVGFKPASIEKHHANIAQYRLNSTVPEDVVEQFETAKNLYLYAWFVYRFYPVADFLALACLELALRERYEKEIPQRDLGRGGKPSLSSLLRYAIKCGHIKNEGFKKWHNAIRRKAINRYENNKYEEMRDKELESIELDYSEAGITDADRRFDFVKILFESLPSLRNHYAHGTSMHRGKDLSTIEFVAEMINQVYPENNPAKETL